MSPVTCISDSKCLKRMLQDFERVVDQFYAHYHVLYNYRYMLDIRLYYITYHSHLYQWKRFHFNYDDPFQCFVNSCSICCDQFRAEVYFGNKTKLWQNKCSFVFITISYYFTIKVMAQPDQNNGQVGERVLILQTHLTSGIHIIYICVCVCACMCVTLFIY